MPLGYLLSRSAVLGGVVGVTAKLGYAIFVTPRRVRVVGMVDITAIPTLSPPPPLLRLVVAVGTDDRTTAVIPRHLSFFITRLWEWR